MFSHALVTLLFQYISSPVLELCTFTITIKIFYLSINNAYAISLYIGIKLLWQEFYFVHVNYFLKPYFWWSWSSRLLMFNSRHSKTLVDQYFMYVHIFLCRCVAQWYMQGMALHDNAQLISQDISYCHLNNNV